MCGIFGFQGSFDATRLEAMAAALAHRGPDDRGLFADPPARVGLGQTRLSIIDLSPAGHQPMSDASGRFTIVYNGELYNYRELRASLVADGHRFRGHSDTEVLVECFAREGERILPRLDGIFAFAVWDRERRELFLARDALGVKPLYVHAGRQGVAFASELKALVPLLPARTLDAASLHRYLSFLWCPGDGTPLREVRRLAPGEAAVVVDGAIRRRFTWYELPARRELPVALRPEDAMPAVTAGLRDAIRRQLVADVPVGAFLSGGLDSSAIVALAREFDPGIRCFTIELAGGHDAGFADDLPYARRAASHLGVPLEVVRVEAADMAADIERMVWLLDEPLADPAPLNVLYISRLAREQGYKVLLSGAGGDDLFSGYRRHLALQYERWWAWLPTAVRAQLAGVAERLGAASAAGRRLQRLFANAAEDGPHRLASYFAWLPEARLRALYTPEFAAQVGAARADAPLVDFLAGTPAGLPPLERMLALEQRFFLADHNLAYTDRMSMAAGVEVRVPFLDTALVETAARIPAHLKQHGRSGKWVLKRAMAPYLPPDLIDRPKTGFGAPLRRWLRHELRGLADELLAPGTLARRGLFNPAAVGALRAADAAGRTDAAYTLFSMMAIEIWCRRFVDGTP